MAWSWVAPCPLVPALGWCISNAGCPITIRSINGPRSIWEHDAPECRLLREIHPETKKRVPGFQLTLKLK
jgi:hypothetical protein